MSVKPEFFGKFILLDKIAAGGMAEVYRAKAPGAEGIGKILAIKRILPQYTANPEFIEMFKGEAKIAVNLTQGNIGQIYEFGLQSDQFFLLMEFIDGRNLRQILSRCSKIQKALTIEQCVYTIAQVSNGLDYAHRCTNKNTGTHLNIIHRDMSPQNIMISYEGEIKIIDFGIAKAESKIENTRAGTLKGKFGYMSPEQAEGMELDARTDIFSLGIVLWELLSGERLFVANNEVNTIRKIRECQIPSLKKINPNIPEELERISMKTLAKDRSLRYQTAAELYRDLSRFLYKVNPEFTQHELSVFIKNLFREEILEDRKKITEFAKIGFPEPERQVTVSQLTQTQTRTEPSEDEVLLVLSNSVPEIEMPKAQSLNSFNKKSKEFSLKLGSLEIVKEPTQLKKPFNLTRPGISPLGHDSPTITSSYQNRHGSHVIAKMAAFSIFVAGVTISLFLFFKYPDKIMGPTVNFARSLVSQHLDIGSVTSVTPAFEPSPPDKVKTYITSIPAGAQIEVNGIPESSTTPAEIIVPNHKVIKLTLRHEGYLTQQHDFEPKFDGDSFTVSLQKSMVAYLNIDVIPNDAVIYLNNEKLNKRSPIRNYPVPAGKKIIVKAFNPYHNTSDQTTVVLKQDTSQNVKLFLKRKK